MHSVLIQSLPVQLIHKRVITKRLREAARRPGRESRSYIHGNSTCTHITGYTGIIPANTPPPLSRDSIRLDVEAGSKLMEYL